MNSTASSDQKFDWISEISEAKKNPYSDTWFNFFGKVNTPPQEGREKPSFRPKSRSDSESDWIFKISPSKKAYMVTYFVRFFQKYQLGPPKGEKVQFGARIEVGTKILCDIRNRLPRKPLFRYFALLNTKLTLFNLRKFWGQNWDVIENLMWYSESANQKIPI